MYRHHIYEVHISHFMAAMTGENTKAPRRGIYVRLQKIWPSVVERVQLGAQEKTLVLLDSSSIKVGSLLHAQALKSLQLSNEIPSAGVTTSKCASWWLFFLEESWKSLDFASQVLDMRPGYGKFP